MQWISLQAIPDYMSYFRDKYEPIVKDVRTTSKMENIMREEYQYITKTTGDNQDPYDRSDEPASVELITRMEKLCYET